MKVVDLFEEQVDDYVKRLTKSLDIKTLGKGAFSTVFQHPVYHNVTVKLTRDPDPHHILWLREAEKHQGNPWFPKIIGIHKVMFHSDDLDKKTVKRDEAHDAALEGRHLIFMQKLRPMTRVEDRNLARYLLSQMQEEERYDRLRLMSPKQSVDELYDGIWEDIVKHSKDKHLVELAKVLVKVGADDLHRGNIMMRDDGSSSHPVVTDPVASY